MLDLNRLLLFIAWLSPLVVIARTARRAAANRNWRLAALVVLLVTALACLLAPQQAGYVGGGAWFALLFLPVVGLRKAAQLVIEERFASARRIVSWLRFLHPVRVVRDESLVLRALDLAQQGDTPAALKLLERIAPNDTRAGRRAVAHGFRIRTDWGGLVGWCRQNIPRVGLGEDPSLLLLYWRALGETSARDELVLQFAGRALALRASPLHEPIYLAGLMVVLAFAGRTAALQARLQTELRGLCEDAKEFWIATAEAAASQIEISRSRLMRLRERTSDALIRADIARRMDGGYRAAPIPLTRPSEETVDRFERSRLEPRGFLLPRNSSRPPPAVAIFIVLNVLVFFIEMALGGTTNVITLHRLGALEPWAVFAGHQYWRLLTALFMHYGAVHLLVNVYALYVLGPTLETAIGTTRFAICYLIAGLGSSLGVVLSWRFRWTQADLIVGASGCVMGLVGAWAGYLILHRHAPMARRRLTSLAVIVVMQTALDFYTPQVSMTAHLSGLVTGLLIGLIISPRPEWTGRMSPDS